MLYIGAEGLRTAKQPRSWRDKARAFADTLPEK
jgi:hypothetical protein